MSYNYLSGEPITGLEEGRPLFLRSPDSVFNLATFMRTHLFASLATLRIGMDVLQKEEGVRLDRMFAHGGLFKTKGVAQGFLAAAIDTPVSVGEVAAEGGAWGIAVLAAFVAGRTPGRKLGRLLEHPGLRRHCSRHGRARRARRRRLRRIHPAVRRCPAGRTGGRRPHLTNSHEIPRGNLRPCARRLAGNMRTCQYSTRDRSPGRNAGLARDRLPLRQP